MPGYLLHFGATVMCMHAGQAQPTVPNNRVLVSNQPTVVQPNPYTIVGCTFVPPANGPCVTAQWITAAPRLKSNGLPLLLQDSKAICTPTSTGLNIILTQLRVKGT